MLAVELILVSRNGWLVGWLVGGWLVSWMSFEFGLGLGSNFRASRIKSGSLNSFSGINSSRIESRPQRSKSQLKGHLLWAPTTLVPIRVRIHPQSYQTQLKGPSPTVFVLMTQSFFSCKILSSGTDSVLLHPLLWFQDSNIHLPTAYIKFSKNNGCNVFSPDLTHYYSVTWHYAMFPTFN